MSNERTFASMEPLESRQHLSSNQLILFYGLGGPGGFGNDWLQKIAEEAAEATQARLGRYREHEVDRALTRLLRTLDRDGDKSIERREVRRLQLRVLGYSLGGVQAANFTRQLNRKGETVAGHVLERRVPVRALVTLDPVNSNAFRQTKGPQGNVLRFANYFQRKGGDTTVDVYTEALDIKVHSVTVDDPEDLRGDRLPSDARRSRQFRVDRGPLASETVSHDFEDGLELRLEGRKVNHGTVPFFVHDRAMADLTR